MILHFKIFYWLQIYPGVVKTSEALEIIAYCLFDGKVDQESELETNLYNDLVDQLKDIFWRDSKGFPFAWIYLKMFGQITESLCDQIFWTFTAESFKNALGRISI